MAPSQRRHVGASVLCPSPCTVALFSRRPFYCCSFCDCQTLSPVRVAARVMTERRCGKRATEPRYIVLQRSCCLVAMFQCNVDGLPVRLSGLFNVVLPVCFHERWEDGATSPSALQSPATVIKFEIVYSSEHDDHANPRIFTWRRSLNRGF